MIKRNLIYYICPFEHSWDVCKQNLDFLLPHLPKFNGRKIITIIQGPAGFDKKSERPTVDAKRVMDYFPKDIGIEYRLVSNDPALCETRFFFPILRELYSLNPNENTFYAHAKGVRYDKNLPKSKADNLYRWRERGYKHNLTDIELIDSMLQEFDCVGCFKRKEWKPRVHGQAPWHYSGTFFWFNHKKIYSREEYDTHNPNRCGVESWLGHNVPYDKAGCVYACDLGQRTSVYGMSNAKWQHYDSLVKDGIQVDAARDRTDVINQIAERIGAETYLEIGIRRISGNFQHINVKDKTGVDPNPRDGHDFIIKKTSDDFFKDNEKKFDLIFIDGDHVYEQVIKDVLNSLKSLNKGGVVVMHDTWPPTEECASRKYVRGKGAWCGDAYKAAAEALALPGIQGYTLDCDYGVTVLWIEEVNFPELDYKTLKIDPCLVKLTKANEFKQKLQRLNKVEHESQHPVQPVQDSAPSGQNREDKEGGITSTLASAVDHIGPVQPQL